MVRVTMTTPMMQSKILSPPWRRDAKLHVLHEQTHVLLTPSSNHHGDEWILCL
jgi:hypothetical protein